MIFVDNGRTERHAIDEECSRDPGDIEALDRALDAVDKFVMTFFDLIAVCQFQDNCTSGPTHKKISFKEAEQESPPYFLICSSRCAGSFRIRLSDAWVSASSSSPNFAKVVSSWPLPPIY